MASPKYRHERIRPPHRGWRYRTIGAGRTHKVIVGFPAGPRRKGAGELQAILHPKGESNPCEVTAGTALGLINPSELVILGLGSNPKDWRDYFTAEGATEAMKFRRRVGMALQKTIRREKAKRAGQVKRAATRRMNPYAVVQHHDAPQHESGRGYVVRKLPLSAPYIGAHVLREFKRESAAQAFADKLNAALGRQGYLGNPKKPRKLRRHNAPLDKARELFRKFHGREAGGHFEMQRQAKVRKDYAALGPVVAVGIDAARFDECGLSPDEVVGKWDKLPHLKFGGDKVMLASSPDGRQVYLLGDTNMNGCLERFETDTGKDYVDLGEVPFVVYLARKAPSFEPTDWVHTFGEEGGARPRLAYDKLNKELLFVGGDYTVQAPGIVG